MTEVLELVGFNVLIMLELNQVLVLQVKFFE